MSGKTLAFKLIAPDRVAFDGRAELVIAVTTEGEEGILALHAPFLAALKPGILRANVVGGDSPSRLEFATGEGFMQALPDRVTVLVDEALSFEDVDIAATRDELARAQVRQKEFPAQSEGFAREQSAIDFAIAKLRLTGHH